MPGKWKYTDASCEVVTRQLDANTTQSCAASALPQGTPIDAHNAVPPWSNQALLSITRAGREIALNRLAGIAFAAKEAGDAPTVTACLAARAALLDITTLPAVLAATDDASLTAAVGAAYAGIVAAAPANIKTAFASIQS